MTVPNEWANAEANLMPGHTQVDLTGVDLNDVRKIREVAAALIAEKRSELGLLEAELAVLEEALEQAEGHRADDGATGATT